MIKAFHQSFDCEFYSTKHGLILVSERSVGGYKRIKCAVIQINLSHGYKNQGLSPLKIELLNGFDGLGYLKGLTLITN